eukprot:GHVO01006219.1.p1 GENE.GHVO01006219.1~~GHVO01006219.1.p1  ORF type:complete len:519 (-),score=74.90 GHVO01006219.1:150-1706(-)
MTDTVPLIIGIALTVLGSCLMATGNVCMKIGIHKESLKLAAEDTSLSPWALAQPVWLFGMAQYVLGASIHIGALALAPASVLAPMNSLGLIANAVVAATILGESFGIKESLGTAGTVLGVCFCALSVFLPHDTTQATNGINSWRDIWYIAYMGISGVLVIIALIVVHSEESRVNEESWDRAFSRHIAGGHIEMAVPNSEEKPSQLADIRGIEDIRVVEDRIKPPPRIGLLYGFLAGAIGAQCVLEVKEFAACIDLARGGSKEIWNSPQPYLSLLGLGASALLQIHFLNFGLGRAEATLVIPTYYVCWTIFGTLGGFAKFHECMGFTTAQIVVYSFGLSLTLACVGILAIREISNIKAEIEKDDVETQFLTQSTLRKRVPLSVGYGMMMALGRLGGRVVEERSPKFGLSSTMLLRRTKSMNEMEVGDETRDHPAAFAWTLGGGKLPYLPHPGTQHGTLQSHTSRHNPTVTSGWLSSEVRGSTEMRFSPPHHPSDTNNERTGKPVGQRRGLSDIVFDYDA